MFLTQIVPVIHLQLNYRSRRQIAKLTQILVTTLLGEVAVCFDQLPVRRSHSVVLVRRNERDGM